MAEVAAGVGGAAIGFFLEKLVTMLEREAKLHNGLPAGVKNMEDCLDSMKALLKDIEGKENNEVVRTWVKQVRDISYDAEDVLQEFKRHLPQGSHKHGISAYLYGKAHSIKHLLPHRQIAVRVQQIKTRFEGISNLKESLHFHGLEQGSSSRHAGNDPQMALQLIEDNELVGISKHKDKLIDLLINEESKQLMVISVVGPGGVGKTTLIKKVYDSQQVKGHFIRHAWIDVPQPFNRKELLKRMLKELSREWTGEDPEEIDTMVENKLIEELRTILQKKERYVIIFDDVWNIDIWIHIKPALPDNNCGSRVVFTTCKSDVAGHVYNLQPLPYGEAYNLFCMKAFQSNSGRCPSCLMELSHSFVKICGGFPLAIVTICDILSKLDMTEKEWKKLHDRLDSEVERNPSFEIMRKKFTQSYNDLPDYLSDCFLYFSIFPENYPIKCTRLTRLWIAEGFVHSEENRTLEEVADECLNDLIRRNLIAEAELGFDGTARSFSVHSITHKIIRLKSKENNFSTIFGKHNGSSSDTIRRLSVHNNCKNITGNISFTNTRSLFMFEVANLFDSSGRMVLSSFSSLKVLDLEDAPIETFPDEITDLLQLRYLSMRNTKIKVLPKSLGKLRMLETLDLKQTDVSKLPTQILKLQKLRHLLVYRYIVDNHVNFDCVQGLKVPPGIRNLTSLQKLSCIKVKGGSGIIEELGCLTELRKLGIMGLKKKDGKDLCISLQRMQKLQSLDVKSISKEEVLDLHELSTPQYLEHLYLKGSLEKLPDWISSLRSLVRIGLTCSRLSDNPLKALQALSNLKQLQLLDAYTGEQLHFKAGTFQSLKMLELDQLDQLNTVIVEDGTMPSLQTLIMKRCRNLKSVPVGVLHLKYLKKLFLCDMPEEFITKLQRNGGEDRPIVDHISLIHSFSLQSSKPWSFKNLS